MLWFSLELYYFSFGGKGKTHQDFRLLHLFSHMLCEGISKAEQVRAKQTILTVHNEVSE